MKKYLLHIIFLFSTLSLVAQSDIKGKKGDFSLKFPAKKAPEVSSKIPEAKPFEPPKITLNTPQEPSVIVQKKEFANPNLPTLRKLNEKLIQEESQMDPDFKGDHFFGDFRNNGKYVKIICRDFGEVDGDMVRVYVNDVIVVDDLMLMGGFRELRITLKQGFNKIDFQALSQGTSGPNTAEFEMYDENGKVMTSNQWNLLTGAKASIIVTKE